MVENGSICLHSLAELPRHLRKRGDVEGSVASLPRLRASSQFTFRHFVVTMKPTTNDLITEHLRLRIGIRCRVQMTPLLVQPA